MSLADELLADLEDGADEEQETEELDTIAEADEEMPEVEVDSSESVKNVAKLRDSEQVLGELLLSKKFNTVHYKYFIMCR